jgi:hypothetical protein
VPVGSLILGAVNSIIFCRYTELTVGYNFFPLGIKSKLLFYLFFGGLDCVGYSLNKILFIYSVFTTVITLGIYDGMLLVTVLQLSLNAKSSEKMFYWSSYLSLKETVTRTFLP